MLCGTVGGAGLLLLLGSVILESELKRKEGEAQESIFLRHINCLEGPRRIGLGAFGTRMRLRYSCRRHRLPLQATAPLTEKKRERIFRQEGRKIVATLEFALDAKGVVGRLQRSSYGS